MPAEFQPFAKIPRLRRNCVITEKIDGSNAQIYIPENPEEPMQVGSRNLWITPEKDNFGFARWAFEHETELRTLGPGRHFGEWWGLGVNRNYGLQEKRFYLFNLKRWEAPGVVLPACVGLVPKLYEGPYNDTEVDNCLRRLATEGSVAAPGFMKPEGIVVFHVASHSLYKVTLGDDGHKESKVLFG